MTETSGCAVPDAGDASLMALEQFAQGLEDGIHRDRRHAAAQFFRRALNPPAIVAIIVEIASGNGGISGPA